MPQTKNEEVLSKLEGQVDDVLKNLDEVLKLHAAPGAPHSDDEGVTGGGKDNTAGHQRKEKKHDQQPKEDKYMKGVDDEDDDGMDKMLADMEKLLNKAKSKSSDDSGDDSDDDSDGNGNGDDDEDDDGFDSPSNTSKTKKAAEDDETLVIDGQRIAKSEVGEAQFDIFKSMSERLTKTEQDLAKARDDAEFEKLKKRADSEFAHLPGSTDERAKLLKRVVVMPKEERAIFEKMLANSEKLAKAAFTSIGFSGGASEAEEMNKSAASFETKVSEIRKRDSCTQTEAMSKARREDPSGFAAYQSSAGSRNGH